jgi:type 2 lantibiotic biosynthesis protein LanM
MDSIASPLDLQQQTDTAWYNALTLTERIPYSSPTLHFPSTDEKAQQAPLHRAKRWKEQSGFKDTQLFTERLLLDGLTEQDFIKLLSEPVEVLSQRRSSEPTPHWLQDLTAALTAQKTEHTFFVTSETLSISASIVPFQPLLLPGIEKIITGINTLAQERSVLPFDVTTILPQFIAHVAKRMEEATARPLILELHIARLQGQLEGDTGGERMAHFLSLLSHPERLRMFLLDYPVLARYLVTIIASWSDYCVEFLRHLCSDWETLCQEFAPGTNPGQLVEIQCNAGDLHNKGRSVLLLRFSSGLRLVYKPRSLRLDKHFQDLLSWINAQGITPQLRPLTIIDRDCYGWCEFVTSTGCTSKEEITRFYERQGSYLAILYLLDATDIHAENLLAVGEHPVLVDLESLFHARLLHESNNGMNSVLRIGLLPTREFKGKESQGIDISGMAGGQQGQLTPMMMPVLLDTGTDLVHVGHDFVEIPAKQNRPMLNGHTVEVHHYEQHILHGFTQMYRLFLAQRATLQNSLLPSFAQDKVRLIIRPTQVYLTLLHGGLHPDCLQNALERDLLLDHLWDTVSLRSYLKAFIKAEQHELLQGDIPLFHTMPASKAIFTSAGTQLEASSVESALTFVEHRLAAMDEKDLARQQWIIQVSLATTIMDNNEKRMVPLQEQVGQVSKTQFMQAAQAIGDRLCTLALQDEGQANWLGIMTNGDEQGNTYQSLEMADCNLYDGTPGIVLFLAYLASITGDSDYMQLARAGLATVRLQLDALKQINAPLLIGAFSGLGSLIYLFSHLATLWQDDNYLQMADEVLSLIEKQIELDQRLDLMAGSAGCLVSLLSLHTITPAERLLSMALRCGDHLLNQAVVATQGVAWRSLPGQPPITGFSHGTAGIAYSLAKLTALTGEKRFLSAVQGALTYERSLFSQKEKNWTSLARIGDGSITTHVQTTWCHGAPGIGLSRLGIMSYINDPFIYQEIETAIETTCAVGFGYNQSLCHGDLGNLETLLVASQTLQTPRYYKMVEHISAQIFDGIERCGWVTGAPASIETPGLMTGLAGIGYQLLRLAEPERVPSVLLLAPPVTTSGTSATSTQRRS